MKLWWQTLIEWAPRAARQQCSVEQNWFLTPFERRWFTVKALVALVLYCDDDRGRCWRPHNWDDIEVAYGPVHEWEHWEFGQAADWSYLAIPKRGFGFRIGVTGYP